jgi:hypothetical protein
MHAKKEHAQHKDERRRKQYNVSSHLTQTVVRFVSVRSCESHVRTFKVAAQAQPAPTEYERNREDTREHSTHVGFDALWSDARQTVLRPEHHLGGRRLQRLNAVRVLGRHLPLVAHDECCVALCVRACAYAAGSSPLSFLVPCPEEVKKRSVGWRLKARDARNYPLWGVPVSRLSRESAHRPAGKHTAKKAGMQTEKRERVTIFWGSKHRVVDLARRNFATDRSTSKKKGMLYCSLSAIR